MRCWLGYDWPLTPTSMLTGAEEGDAAPRRGWPPVTVDVSRLRVGRYEPAPSSSRLQAPGANHLLASAAVQVGRRIVPPVERPSTGVGTVMGRERPRRRTASAAPTPAGGVAHAPRVSVGDVLGRASMARGKSAWNAGGVSGKTSVGNEPEITRNRSSFLARIRCRLPSLRRPNFRDRLGASRVRSLRSPLPRP